MMLRCALFSLIFLCLSCSNQHEKTTAYADEIREHRKEITKRFLVDASSPLEEKDKKYFVGLNYFEANPEYRLWASFNKFPNKNAFQLNTTGQARLAEYTLVGELVFQLQDSSRSLGVFAVSENELFVPFGDLTNGKETYEAGRYLDLQSTDSSHVLVDFNKAYNPYCAYNEKYSCVIPPPENRLNVRIEAGEKKFRD